MPPWTTRPAVIASGIGMKKDQNKNKEIILGKTCKNKKNNGKKEREWYSTVARFMALKINCLQHEQAFFIKDRWIGYETQKVKLFCASIDSPVTVHEVPMEAFTRVIKSFRCQV